MILLHLVHPQGRGFIFASSRNQGLIPSINNALQEDMRAKNTPLSIVDLKEEELPLQTIQKAAAEYPNHALIVNFLDILIVTQGADILQSLNYGREALNQLNVPILFWASESTRQLLANQAIDLYSQRRFADIVFEDAPLSTDRPSLDSHFDTQFKTTEEYQNIKLRITLLESQLEETKENHISEKSICESLVPQLINAYVEYKMLNEAQKLVDTYESCFEGTIVQLESLGRYYESIGLYEKALKLFEQKLSLELEKKFEQTHDGQKELAGTYSWLASINSSLNILQKALEFNLKAIDISATVSPKPDEFRAALYNNLAKTYSNLGEQDKALKYNFNALGILAKISPQPYNNVAATYNNLAAVYIKLRQNKKALEFNLKALSILEKKSPSNHPDLGTMYSNVAGIFNIVGQPQKALEYNLKALSIDENNLPSLHPNLAITYSNIASTYYELKNLPKAIDFMQKAVAIREKTLPLTNLDRQKSKQYLTHFLEERQAEKKK